MRILITGANGFVSQYLIPLLLQEHEVFATAKGECRIKVQSDNFTYLQMDITDPFQVHDVFERIKPGVVVHTAAISKPDDCEKNQFHAWQVNVESTLTLLNNAAETGAHFIFLSTDFVFDGIRGMYVEDDEPSPVNYYGRTKLEAEEAVREYAHTWTIIRTILVYGRRRGQKHNIVSLIAEKLSKQERYGVFDDQFRTPTYVEDLAKAIAIIIIKKASGIFHISGKDIATPFQLALSVADILQADKALIYPMKEGDLAFHAKRPPKTGFDVSKARNELGWEPLSLEEGLREIFKK